MRPALNTDKRMVNEYIKICNSTATKKRTKQ